MRVRVCQKGLADFILWGFVNLWVIILSMSVFPPEQLPQETERIEQSAFMLLTILKQTYTQTQFWSILFHGPTVWL